MSTSSRRVVATGFGGPEQLSVEEVSLPDPGSHEVRVVVRAAGVNPIDAKMYAAGDPASLPVTLGFEASGVVTEVGADAADDAGPLSVGDEVIVFRFRGTYAADLVVPDSALTRKPPGLGWPESSALLLSGATAVHTLEATAVGEDDTVLVHGASGGVGSFAVQLAKALGAEVTGVCSTSRLARKSGRRWSSSAME